MQGTNDDNLTPDMARNFAAAYARAGGSISFHEFDRRAARFHPARPELGEFTTRPLSNHRFYTSAGRMTLASLGPTPAEFGAPPPSPIGLGIQFLLQPARRRSPSKMRSASAS